MTGPAMDFIDKKLKEDPPNIAQAKDALKQVKGMISNACDVLGKDKGKFKSFMDLNFYGVLKMQILAIETR